MAKEKNPKYGNKVKTGECFASFPCLANPDTGKQYSDNKYKVDAIFTDKSAMDALVKECKEVAQRNFGKTEGIKWPWKKGDEGSISKFQGYPGHMYITPKTKNPIPVVGPNPMEGVIDPAKVYGGAIIKVNVTPCAYEKPEEVIEVLPDGTRRKTKVTVQGITLYLNGVQFVRDSERFGGNGDVSGMFDNESGEESTDGDNLW
jgi:hypothetical protein